ncbi:MAG: hypothetical protein AAF590_05310 [Pseudomonadota bacterium]
MVSGTGSSADAIRTSAQSGMLVVWQAVNVKAAKNTPAHRARKGIDIIKSAP